MTPTCASGPTWWLRIDGYTAVLPLLVEADLRGSSPRVPLVDFKDHFCRSFFTLFLVPS